MPGSIMKCVVIYFCTQIKLLLFSNLRVTDGDPLQAQLYMKGHLFYKTRGVFNFLFGIFGRATKVVR